MVTLTVIFFVAAEIKHLGQCER